MALTILDSRERMRELDKENVLGSVEHLPDQIEHAWEEIKKIEIDPSYRSVKRVVFSGMGGSGLGSHVIKTLYKDRSNIPFEVINHYALPAYVDEETLVVLSSYSGTTEETIASAEDAIKKKAKVVVITAGGKLADLAEQHHWPIYKMNPVHNPSNQPRMAIGYSVFGQLGLLARMGLIELSDEDVASTVALLRKNNEFLSPESIDKNSAKFLAYASVDKMLFLVASEHLEGAIHVFNNQLNENAKNASVCLSIPELNHHFMEGLSFPTLLKDGAIFLFFNSVLYHPRVQKRYPITATVVDQQGYPSEMVQSVWKTKLQQVWEVIQLGAYTNFYLSMLNGINPSPIPWVDQFKAELSK
jgi:glucose/mannose-6-phosphate isomerase